MFFGLEAGWLDSFLAFTKNKPIFKNTLCQQQKI
jgi:hypothetical protein